MNLNKTDAIIKQFTYERKHNMAVLNKRYIKAIYYWIKMKRWEKKIK